MFFIISIICIYIDGLKGIQINLLDPTTGPVQFGSFLLPFSLLIGIGLVLFVLGTIGISRSSKLGAKYLWRGVKLMVPILIIIAIILLSSFAVSSISGLSGEAGDAGSEIIVDVMNALSSSPGGGQESIAVQTEGISGQIDMQWGLGLGGTLLLAAGLILVIAGIMEPVAKTSFFETKVPEKKLLKTKKPPVD